VQLVKQVGRAISHESATQHVTGAALYTEDLAGRFSNILHAWPVMSEHAHGRVLALHVEEALRVEGVVTVLTRGDVPGENDTGAAHHDEPLFPDEALYLGQPLAWVLGSTVAQARRGAGLVRVEYEVLPAILDIDDARKEEGFHTGPLVIVRGDPEQALLGSAHRLEGSLHMGAQEHFYLETQAAIAFTDESGHLMVHSSTQHPAETQEICARVLGLKKNEVVCQSLRMGGAFGGKEVQANPYAAVAAIGTAKTGRPVSVRLDRQRDMVLTGKRHPFLGEYVVGFDADGRIEALRVELYSNGGYSLDLSEPVMYRAMFHIDNAYYLPNVSVVGRVCRTNLPSSTAFRGFGGPQGMLVIEEVLDRIARHLGMPPHVVRERNFYSDGQKAHYGQVIKDAGRIRSIWDELCRDSEFDSRLNDAAAFNAASPHKKRGIAITPVKFGISFTTAFFNQAGALVLVDKDGSVQVNHGGTEMGQGLHTKIQQIAADALGLPLAAVRIMPTRTDKVPNTSATAASSGSDLNGAAVKAACDQIRERLTEVAGRMLDAAPKDVVFSDGEVFAAGAPNQRIPFAQLTGRAYLDRVPLFSTGYYRTPNITFDAEKGKGKPFHYYAYGAAVAEVEVDGFTGMYRMVRADILHDCGESLSPLVDRGQVEGGYIQGLGWLTCEEVVWDDEGRLGTRGASTYKLPTLAECPEEFHVRLLPKAADPDVIHGSKAVGEPPFMLAISVREALRQAISSFGKAEAVELASPATPEAVFWAIERVRDRV
jgi:xanthine dehydrogenase large subunit